MISPIYELMPQIVFVFCNCINGILICHSLTSPLWHLLPILTCDLQTGSPICIIRMLHIYICMYRIIVIFYHWLFISCPVVMSNCSRNDYSYHTLCGCPYETRLYRFMNFTHSGGGKITEYKYLWLYGDCCSCMMFHWIIPTDTIHTKQELIQIMAWRWKGGML